MTKGGWSKPVKWTGICLSIDLCLVAWTVLDALRLELLLNVLRNTTLHRDGVHAAHVFI